MTFRFLAPTGALALVFLLAGCDSGASDEPADLRLDITPTVGSAAFQAGEPFTVNGVTGQLNVAQMYLSGITLVREDGREILLMADAPITVRAQDENETEVQHVVDERVVFADLAAGPSVTPLGDVPSGRYTGLRFLLGIDGLDNRINPIEAPVNHPLAPKAPSMHWSWNTGYVFVRLDGLLDVDGDGTVDPATDTAPDPASGGWRLHTGLSDNAVTVELDQPFTLDGGEQETLAIQVDLARLVQGVDLGDASQRWCMTFRCQDVVDTATANAAAAFSLASVR